MADPLHVSDERPEPSAKNADAASPSPPQTHDLSGAKPQAALTASAAVRWSIRVLALIALGISSFLLYESLRGGSSNLPGCGANTALDCDHVLNSRYSKFFGLPVSVPAIGLYALVLLSSLFLGPTATPVARRRAWAGLLLLASAAAGAAAWMVFVQLVWLKTVCPYCMAAHACAAVLALVAYARTPLVRRSPALAVLLIALGLAGAAALPVGAARSQMRVLLLGNKVGLDPKDYPIMGSPDARHVLVEIFDYTCPHCKELHGQLKAARARYAGRVAVVALPVPLDAACNPHVTKTQPLHEGGCELANLGLAVWLARPDRFEAFGDWAFSHEDPPKPADARAEAERLAGRDALAAALADPRGPELLDRAIKLYEVLWKQLDSGQIPMVIIGNSGAIAQGQPGTPEELFALLEKELGIGAGGGPATQPAAADAAER